MLHRDLQRPSRHPQSDECHSHPAMRSSVKQTKESIQRVSTVNDLAHKAVSKEGINCCNHKLRQMESTQGFKLSKGEHVGRDQRTTLSGD
eukprot:scaffold42063_cov18-Tisochrysis_lutea.AAC.1